MVRDFRASDQDELRLLVLAGLRERWGEVFDAGHNPDLDDFVANYVERGADVVVVESDGRLVATGTLVPEADGTGRIVRMSVARAYRRRGLAQRVVAELVARARRRGMCAVRVLADTPWTSAVALYRACGFTEVESDPTDTGFVMQL
jgi:ribosomal protein S18 acetylase RimI-like enzyme